MAVFANIPAAEIAIDQAVKSSTASKFRDNPEATFEGDPTAKTAGKGLAIEKDFGAGLQTAIITDDNDVDKVLTPDGVGGARWSANVPGMILIERKEVVAAVTTVSFAGLNGEVDELYKLVGRINHPTGNKTYTVRPNGNVLNTQTRPIIDGVFTVNLGGLVIINTGAVASFVGFEMLIHAREIVQAISFVRLAYWKSVDSSLAAVPSRIQDAVGTIPALVGNIITLDIASSVALGIGVGSTFNLYKLVQGL